MFRANCELIPYRRIERCSFKLLSVVISAYNFCVCLCFTIHFMQAADVLVITDKFSDEHRNTAVTAYVSLYDNIHNTPMLMVMTIVMPFIDCLSFKPFVCLNQVKPNDCAIQLVISCFVVVVFFKFHFFCR